MGHLAPPLAAVALALLVAPGRASAQSSPAAAYPAAAPTPDQGDQPSNFEMSLAGEGQIATTATPHFSGILYGLSVSPVNFGGWLSPEVTGLWAPWLTVPTGNPQGVVADGAYAERLELALLVPGNKTSLVSLQAGPFVSVTGVGSTAGTTWYPSGGLEVVGKLNLLPHISEQDIEISIKALEISPPGYPFQNQVEVGAGVVVGFGSST